MKYKETNTNINISGMTPTYTLPNDYFEFEITGKNTTTNKDIWYDINIKWGDQETGKTRIRDEFLRFTLKEKIDNGEWTTPIDAKKYSDFQNGLRMWVNKIGKDQTTDTTRTYRLYVWIDGGVKIGNNEQDYTISEWNNLFASVKVDVTGDFIEKVPYQEPTTATFDVGSVVNTKMKLLMNNYYNLRDGRELVDYTNQDLTEEDGFDISYIIQENNEPNLNTLRTENILSSSSSEKQIIAWYFDDGEQYGIKWYTDADIVYLNEDSSHMFQSVGSYINEQTGLRNVNTSRVTNMNSMFASAGRGVNINDINFDFRIFSNWDVSNVVDMSKMFWYVFNGQQTSSIPKDASPLNNWNVSNVESFDGMFLTTIECGEPSFFTYPDFSSHKPNYHWDNSEGEPVYGMISYKGSYVPNN